MGIGREKADWILVVRHCVETQYASRLWRFYSNGKKLRRREILGMASASHCSSSFPIFFFLVVGLLLRRTWGAYASNLLLPPPFDWLDCQAAGCCCSQRRKKKANWIGGLDPAAAAALCRFDLRQRLLPLNLTTIHTHTHKKKGKQQQEHE